MLSIQVQCRGCPFWCWNAQKKATWRGGGTPNRTEMWFFQGAKVDEIGWTSWNNLDPKADIFQWDSSPRPSSTMSRHTKTLCPGQEVARFSEAAKREQQGDTLTGKQNSSMTLWTSWCGRSRLPLTIRSEDDQNSQDLDCLLSLLLNLIRSAFAISHSRQWWSERPRSGLPSLTSVWSGHRVAAKWGCRHEMSWVSSMSFVYLSKCHPIALFLLLHRTRQPLDPDTGFLHACS